jgi:glycine oxidase
MARPDIAVVGGGIVGRLLAWRAARQGLRVALYEAGSSLGEESAAWVAAGMIAPVSEAIETSPKVAFMGQCSLKLWRDWLPQLPGTVFFRDAGTLLLWHGENASEARRVETILAARQAEVQFRRLDGAQLRCLEPVLDGTFPQGLHLAGDAQVDNRELLKAIAIALEESNVQCHWYTFIADLGQPDAEVVVDCRGMGARDAWPHLRGVRGEVVRLYAPDIQLHHMLRLLHPRYAVYVVPRPAGMFVVGATSIESNDRSEVSVRGALELLSGAYSLLPALAEARIREFATQVRPALPDNLPALRYERDQHVLRINGLYRHGFLLAPALVEQALSMLSALPSESRDERTSPLCMSS